MNLNAMIKTVLAGTVYTDTEAELLLVKISALEKQYFAGASHRERDELLPEIALVAAKLSKAVAAEIKARAKHDLED